MSKRILLTEDAARHIWERAAQRATSGESVASVAEQLLVDLEHGLRRWVGAEGFAALLSRAIAEVQLQHPALNTLGDLGIEVPKSQNGQVFSPAEISAGVIALLSALIKSLGRIIGNELAMRLIEQTGRPNPRGPVGSATSDTHHE